MSSAGAWVLLSVFITILIMFIPSAIRDFIRFLEKQNGDIEND